MAIQQSDIDRLNQAIADGVRSVTIGGDTTIYNTSDSLIRARDDLQQQFRAQQQTTAARRVSRRTLLTFGGRGYNP